MPDPEEEARRIYQKFFREYVYAARYAPYFRGCAILTLDEMIASGTIEYTQLQKEENGSSFCLKATLTRKPPAKVYLPTYYEGLRVFYELPHSPSSLPAEKKAGD